MPPQQQQPNPQGLYPNRPTPPAGPPPEYQSASQSKHHHGKGLLISVIILSVLLLGVSGFAVWAYMERQEYKNNVDGIVATEVEQAVTVREQQLEAAFAEREKEPLTSYTSPSAYGEVTVEYPKTWSAYVEETDSGSTPVEGFFHPGFVPNENDNVIALRLEISNRSYADSLRRFESLARSDRVSISPVEAVKVDGVVGSRIDGEISSDTEGSVVLFELRDKTLILTTESTEFRPDFDDIILQNLTFNP
jgi:hypothetical protein